MAQMTRRSSGWAWLWVALWALFAFLPLLATFDFSLRALKGVLSFEAYRLVFADPAFYSSLLFSLQMAAITIVVSILLVVPTAYWVHLRLPRARPLIEFITLMPFVVPAVVIAFGYIRLYCCRPVPLVSSPLLLAAGYVVLSFPYMYRAADTGLRAMDVRALTEAAQGLGAGWLHVFLLVILPNLRVSLLSGAFLAFATVMGEFTLSSLLAWSAFGPYMQQVGAFKAYEPSALAIISFALTWLVMLTMQWVGHSSVSYRPLVGVR
jgi:putative spermidine/putrescine transport system permease protein